MLESLMLRMINIYGFENEITIEFCRMCESQNFTIEVLETIVKAHEEFPVFI